VSGELQHRSASPGSITRHSSAVRAGLELIARCLEQTTGGAVRKQRFQETKAWPVRAHQTLSDGPNTSPPSAQGSIASPQARIADECCDEIKKLPEQSAAIAQDMDAEHRSESYF